MAELDREQRDLLIGSYSVTELPKTRIAQILGISAEEISRALYRLRQSGRLVETKNILLGDSADIVARFMRATELEKQLREAFRDTLGRQEDNIWVVPNESVITNAGELSPAICRNVVGRFAAEKISGLIRRNAPGLSIGVSYGRSIRRVVDYLLASEHGENGASATVFNLVGDLPLDPRGSQFDNEGDTQDTEADPLRFWSAFIAEDLARALGTKEKMLWHVPGWIPLDESRDTAKALKETRRAVLKAFELYEGFRRVFGREQTEGRRSGDCLLGSESPSLLLSSIGPRANLIAYLEHSQRLYPEGEKRLFRLADKALREADGDVSGVILYRGGRVGRSALASSFIGPTYQDFERNFEQAEAKGQDGLGNLIVAIGKERAVALKAALETPRLVNHLICDFAVCTEVLRLKNG